MKNINFNIGSSIIRIISGTALATFILAGAGYARTAENTGATNHNLAHYTKVAGEDTGHAVKIAADDTAHAVKVSVRATGRFFGRVGRAIV